MRETHPSQVPSGRWKALALSAAALGVSLGATLLLVEAALRWIPATLPSGSYSMGQRYDESVQSPVHATRVIYNKVRWVERTANRAGFLDLEHAEAKPPGIVRIGFFGDSYVEAAQVLLEETFFRRLARSVEPKGVEILAFGISGWGTLHSFLAHRELARRFGLDASVYVFVENDPGDSSWEINLAHPIRAVRRPFAELSEEPPGFRIRWYGEGTGNRVSGLFRAVYDRSLLAHVVWSRLVLLRDYGLQPRDRTADAAMMTVAGAIPEKNDLPSTWPEPYAEHARELGRRILAQWVQEARDAGLRFAVLYTPRGEVQVRGELPDAQTWKPWLLETCAALGVPLIDPSPELRAALAAGESVYDDHWTPAGHAAVAAALERSPWFGQALEQ